MVLLNLNPENPACSASRVGRQRRQRREANDAYQLDPLKLALVKTELELCVGRRLLSRVFTGIGIPSRKNQARHTGQLCSIRDKSGGGRSGA